MNFYRLTLTDRSFWICKGLRSVDTRVCGLKIELMTSELMTSELMTSELQWKSEFCQNFVRTEGEEVEEEKKHFSHLSETKQYKRFIPPNYFWSPPAWPSPPVILEISQVPQLCHFAGGPIPPRLSWGGRNYEYSTVLNCRGGAQWLWKTSSFIMILLILSHLEV